MRRIFTIALVSAFAAAQGGPGPAIGPQPGDPLPSLEHVRRVTGGFCIQCLFA